MPYISFALRALRPYVPRALRALVHEVSRALRALEPYVPCDLSALVPQVPHAQHTLMHLMPYSSHFLYMPLVFLAFQLFQVFFQSGLQLITMVRNFYYRKVVTIVFDTQFLIYVNLTTLTHSPKFARKGI